MLYPRYLLGAVLFCPIVAFAQSSVETNQNYLLMGLVIILGGVCLSWSLSKIGISSVVGEIIIGVIIAWLAHSYAGFWEQLLISPEIAFLATLGSVLLLFEIGLDSDFKSLISIGWYGVIVALVGVVLPLVLGYFVVAKMVLHSQDFKLNLFISATLAATSTGISIRVFKEFGILKNIESQIVLAASVIDDILGLMILAIVSGLAISGVVGIKSVGLILLNVTIFFVSALVIKLVLPRVTSVVRKFSREDSVLVMLLMVFALFLSWLAGALGLSAIIGAFVAGLVISHNNKTKLVKAILPLNYVLVPIFFVYAGMHVNLSSITSWHTVIIGAWLTLAAIIGKVFCGIFLPKGINHWLVGVGMLPRGEVGLIFALAGKQLGVFSNDIFAAVIIMVLVTTIITPFLLQLIIQRKVKNEN